MYINFWYPVCKSTELTTVDPFRTQMLALNFAVFRDKSGQAHVLSDTCVHRGGSLGKGWMTEGSVVCPYHGWRFGGDGKCTTIPSIGYDGKPPARAKVDSYPVQEKYGIIFAFLGDLPEEERPPLFEIEEFDKEGWRANGPVVLELNFNYERSMENAMDPAHNEFVHPTHGYMGANPDYRVKEFEVEDWDWGSWSQYEFNSRGFADDTSKQMRDQGTKTIAGTGTHGPSTLTTRISLTQKTKLHQYFFETPIDENRTRLFFIGMRNKMLDPMYDADVMKNTLVVAQQDIDVLNEVFPIRTPSSTTQEVLMPADKAIVRYREWLRRFDSKGWRIDVAALRANYGDVALAIPCPERRMSGNWVINPIPLISAGEGKKAAAE